MQLALILGGVLVLAATGVDIVWTTIGTHGGGPLSKHLCRRMWRIALAIHGRRSHHRALSFVGTIILITTVAFWIATTCLGWILIYSSDPSSLLETHTDAPATLAGRIYFAAYTMSTLGNGDYKPNGGVWQIVVAVATLSGIALVTLSVTFILSVVSAVVEKRVLGAYISDLGGTPSRILRRAWSGERFEELEAHLLQLSGMLQLYVEHHLAYPVLYYFHSETPRTATELRLNGLHDAILLLSEGVAPERRLPQMITQPLLDALEALAVVYREEGVGEAADEPPLTLAPLRELGIDTVSADAFRVAVDRAQRTRRTLLGALRADGWTWQEAMDA